MITYRYNLNREPKIENDRYNHDKINPWFIALIKLSVVNRLIVGFVLFSRLCHKFSPMFPVSLSSGATVSFPRLVVQSFFPFRRFLETKIPHHCHHLAIRASK